MSKEKIIKAVNSALAYLNYAVNSKTKDSKENVYMLTWKASSDLEYALFLFSLIFINEKAKASWKLLSRQPDINSTIISSRNTLKEVIENLNEDNFDEAFKKTWITKGQLLRINDFFEKERVKD
jgi:hypothetical protein